MLTALTTLFLLTAISFALVVIAMTLRDSWGKIVAALVPVYVDTATVRAARRTKRITRRPATFRTARAEVRAAA